MNRAPDFISPNTDESHDVLFRCDGTAGTGLGHVSRCIALGEAFAELGLRCLFAGSYSEAAQFLIRGAGFTLVDAPSWDDNETGAVARLLAETKPHCVVVDSYEISESHLAELSRQPVCVIAIDDFAGLTAYPCEVVLNFTVNAPQLEYPNGPRYLLGPNYLLVRRRLRHLRARRGPRFGPVRRALVAIGGTDRHGLAQRVVQALREVAPEMVIRVAAAPPEMAGVLAAFAPESGLVAMGQDLAEEFALADICISGGGLTKYEAAYLGVPGAVLSQTPEQAKETRCFVQHDLAFDLGLGPELSQKALVKGLAGFFEADGTRQRIAEAGWRIFPDDPTRNAAEDIAACVTQRP